MDVLKLRDTSDCNFRYDITSKIPYLSDITGSMTIQPRHLLLRFTPDTEGFWCLDLITVFGMPVINGKVKERKRLSDVMFMRPLDGEDLDLLPEWLHEIAEHHVALMNPETLAVPRGLAAYSKTLPEG